MLSINVTSMPTPNDFGIEVVASIPNLSIQDIILMSGEINPYHSMGNLRFKSFDPSRIGFLNGFVQNFYFSTLFAVTVVLGCCGKRVMKISGYESAIDKGWQSPNILNAGGGDISYMSQRLRDFLCQYRGHGSYDMFQVMRALDGITPNQTWYYSVIVDTISIKFCININGGNVIVAWLPRQESSYEPFGDWMYAGHDAVDMCVNACMRVFDDLHMQVAIADVNKDEPLHQLQVGYHAGVYRGFHDYVMTNYGDESFNHDTPRYSARRWFLKTKPRFDHV